MMRINLSEPVYPGFSKHVPPVPITGPLGASQAVSHTLADLIFTGLNKRVAALHRDTGQILWQWRAPSGSSYTTLLLDGDRLIVSVHGYMYALDALTGRQLWQNEMSGYGYGVGSLVSVRGSATPSTLPANAAASDHGSATAGTTAATTAT